MFIKIDTSHKHINTEHAFANFLPCLFCKWSVIFLWTDRFYRTACQVSLVRKYRPLRQIQDLTQTEKGAIQYIGIIKIIYAAVQKR